MWYMNSVSVEQKTKCTANLIHRNMESRTGKARTGQRSDTTATLGRYLEMGLPAVIPQQTLEWREVRVNSKYKGL